MKIHFAIPRIIGFILILVSLNIVQSCNSNTETEKKPVNAIPATAKTEKNLVAFDTSEIDVAPAHDMIEAFQKKNGINNSSWLVLMSDIQDIQTTKAEMIHIFMAIDPATGRNTLVLVPVVDTIHTPYIKNGVPKVAEYVTPCPTCLNTQQKRVEWDITKIVF